ncbi:MAG: zf-TFIIB domain-containing protein [Bacillota bacterium]
MVKSCPVCRHPLKEVARYGVLIDVCPDCRGVWLDRGELEKVVSLAREFRADYDDLYAHGHDRYDKHYREYEHHDERPHGYYHKKKKKHGIFEIFGDLFD